MSNERVFEIARQRLEAQLGATSGGVRKNRDDELRFLIGAAQQRAGALQAAIAYAEGVLLGRICDVPAVKVK